MPLDSELSNPTTGEPLPDRETPQEPQAGSPVDGEKPGTKTHSLAQKYAHLATKERAADVGDNEEPNREKALEGRDPREEPGPQTELQKKIEALKTKESAPPEPKKPADTVPAASLVRVRELVSQGNVADALKAIGLGPEGLTGANWEAWRRDQNKRDSIVDAAKRELTDNYQKMNQAAANLEQKYLKYSQAEEMFKRGERDAALKHAFGEDANTFNRNMLQGMAKRDPAVEQVAQENARLRQEIQEYFQSQNQQNEEQQLNSARQQYHQQLTGEISQLNRAGATDAAQDPDFMGLVYQIQRENFDYATQSVLLSVEEQYDEAVRRERQYIDKRTGRHGLTIPSSVNKVGSGPGGTNNPRGTDGTQSQAAPPPRVGNSAKPRTVLTTDPLEAAADPPLKGKALRDKFVREAIKAATQLASDD